MATRKYLTSVERELLYDHILAVAFIAPMEQWAIEHPEIGETEARHIEGVEWSLKGMREIFNILNGFDLVPRSNASQLRSFKSELKLEEKEQ